MAKRKEIETSGSDTAANPGDATGEAQTGTELPAVESPSISPAKAETAADAATAEEPATPAAPTEAAIPLTDEALAASFTLINFPRLHLRPRHKRYALLAASVAIAAAFGAVVGAAATGGLSKAPAVNIAAIEENKATQQSVAHLTKEITNLKASLEAANKAAHSQIAKLSDRLSRETADITGSVTPPQTVPPASAPLPAPRPAQAAELPPAARLAIVPDWSIRETRDGYVYVQGHGDVYQVVPGAPLPGLGPVEQIKRQDGRWLVVTPKGIIVSMRDRRYFEQF